MTTGSIDGEATRGAVRTAAVILAAGRSSRMGTSKPLLPVGQVTAIERVVSSLRAVGAGQVVVVTGHNEGALLPVLGRLQVDRAHNPDYDSGMFSSVQAGAAALSADVDAFFVSPVDCPLVTPRVLRLLGEHFERSSKGIVFPVCCGRRGHPPLLSAGYIRLLIEADRAGDLQTFLGAFPNDAAEVDTRDLTVLMDMDTPDQHRMLDRFAAMLEGEESSLTTDEALFILGAAGTPANVVEHCRAVAAVGGRLAEALQPRLPALDVALVRAGCLLHDVARLLPDHAALAQEVLANLGLPRLGAVVGRHMQLAPGFPQMPGVTEAELVYLADKLVADDQLVGLDEREARALQNAGPNPERVAAIRARIGDARLIAENVGAVLGRPFSEALAGLNGDARSVDCAPQELSILLARHAEPEGPGGRRFLGQANPGLGAVGEQQAKGLANELMVTTAGAHLDAVCSSDLTRCLRTAEIVAEGFGGVTVRAERWLREIDVGLWEGLTWEEAGQAYPSEHAKREQDVVGRPFPQGESFKDLQARVIPEFLRLIDASLAAGHRRVLIVGHKGVNRVILAYFLGLPLEGIFSIEQDYCLVTELRVTRSPADRVVDSKLQVPQHADHRGETWAEFRTK
jgi:molybdenum cofactor cytidylyltransferase